MIDTQKTEVCQKLNLKYNVYTFSVHQTFLNSGIPNTELMNEGEENLEIDSLV